MPSVHKPKACIDLNLWLRRTGGTGRPLKCGDSAAVALLPGCIGQSRQTVRARRRVLQHCNLRALPGQSLPTYVMLCEEDRIRVPQFRWTDPSS